MTLEKRTHKIALVPAAACAFWFLQALKTFLQIMLPYVAQGITKSLEGRLQKVHHQVCAGTQKPTDW